MMLPHSVMLLQYFSPPLTHDYHTICTGSLQMLTLRSYCTPPRMWHTRLRAIGAGDAERRRRDLAPHGSRAGEPVRDAGAGGLAGAHHSQRRRHEQVGKCAMPLFSICIRLWLYRISVCYIQ
jgi:hypothetical protein